MAKLSKRRRFIQETVGDLMKIYAPQEAVALLKQCSKVKFVESVEVSVNLGVDVRKSNQMVRGA